MLTLITEYPRVSSVVKLVKYLDGHNENLTTCVYMVAFRLKL